jgi:hypothetical protein
MGLASASAYTVLVPVSSMRMVRFSWDAST